MTAPALPWPGSWVLPVVVLLLGASVGSFVNVVAWRLPREDSLLWPGSHCPRCGTSLAWFENLPLLGWLVLRGRCRHCHQPIALRYPLVEFLCAGLWVAMLAATPGGFGASPDPLGLVLSGWLLVSWLFPLVLIDLDLLWLPEPLCRWGLLLGLAVTGLLGFGQGVSEGRALLLAHLIAAALGLLGCEAVSALGQRCLGRPALGLGDAKLAALMGAWLGPLSLGLALLVAVVSGAVVGSVGRLTGRLGPQQPFPFGPFLAFGTVALWWSGPGPWLALLVPGP